MKGCSDAGFPLSLPEKYMVYKVSELASINTTYRLRGNSTNFPVSGVWERYERFLNVLIVTKTHSRIALPLGRPPVGMVC